jgi:hypothetical protein
LDEFFATYNGSSSLLGVANKDRGIKIKRESSRIRRFKQVSFIHTDKEIKDHGIELLDCGK